MLTALDWLILVFMAMSAVSLLAVCLMFFLKNPTAKKITFYFLAIQGMLLAWMNAMMTPDSYFIEVLLGWILGVMSIAALLLVVLGKTELKFKVARILVTVSVVLGMYNAFIY